MKERFAFIGDIHADPSRLSDLLAKVADPNRRLVFLGDYIDHGPKSREVVEILLETKKRQPDAIFLAGNHEIGLLAFLSEKISFLEYAWTGGLPSIRSYLGKAKEDVRREFARAIPRAHLEFLHSCKAFFETADFIACHAGINPALPESRKLEDIVFGRHPSLFDRGFRSGKLVVCGHYRQNTQAPFLGASVVCLNTGCGTSGGPATALIYPEMAFAQA